MGCAVPSTRVFTMVALDEDDKPKQVPRLILETEAQRAEWKAAEKRREMSETKRRRFLIKYRSLLSVDVSEERGGHT